MLQRHPKGLLVRATLAAPIALALLCALAPAGLAATAAGTTPAAPLPVRSGGLVGFDAMTGTVFQEGQSSFSGIGMRLRVRSASLKPNLEFMPTMEYWQNTSRLDAFDIRTRRRDATLGLDARWSFIGTKTWQPYAGAGFALHFLDDELRAPRYGTPRASTGVVRGGLDALAGVDFGMGSRIGSFVEFKFHNVSHYRQLKFNTGLSWNF
jgi:hypothetical protein